VERTSLKIPSTDAKACCKLYDTYYNHKPVVEEEMEEETDFAKWANSTRNW